MKLPEPVQPAVTPVNDHVPDMTLLFTVPCSESWFPLGVPDWIVIPKFPVMTLFVFPVSVKVPDSVVPDEKHGDEVVKLKFVTLRAVDELSVSVVVKPNAVD